MAGLRKRRLLRPSTPPRGSDPTTPPPHPDIKCPRRGASDIVSVAKALMGTAAAGNGQERSGDGESPGARPADQITPEPPEERLPHRPRRGGNSSVEPAAS